MPLPLDLSDLAYMDRRERCRSFGLDCEDALIWEGSDWSLGGEYIKRFKITNVTSQTLHFTYRVPRAKVFFMSYPEKSVLSAGNHVYIEVRFRPIARVAIDDAVEVVTDKGSFLVAVKALLPQLAVSVPSEAVFHAVPVNETTSQVLTVANSGQVDTDFVWDVKAPFSVYPERGDIPAGQLKTFTLSILPREAAVLDAHAVIKFQNGSVSNAVHLRAIAKFQFIAADILDVDFCNVLFTRHSTEEDPLAEKVVHVTNRGPVLASIHVEAVDATIAHQFWVTPHTAVLQPGASQRFTVSYAPAAAGTSSIEYYKLVTNGGNTIQLKMTGRTDGAAVTISKKERAGAPPPKRPHSVQFGDIKVGESMSHVVVLNNHSNMPAHFGFVTESAGIFSFSEVHGVVPALLTKQVVISFAPLVAGNFYKRVVCLIEDSSPCYLDLMGTSYDDAKRPFPLRQRHVDAFRLRSPHLRLLPFEESLKLVRNQGHASDEFTVSQEMEWQLANSWSKSGDRTRAANAIYRSLFSAQDDLSHPVALLDSVLSFGGASRYRPPEKRVVVICNNSATKMTVQWIVPRSLFSAPGTPTVDEEAKVGFAGYSSTIVRDWAIVPETVDIEAGGRYEFKVAFRPTADDASFCQDLEAYVAPKLNRSFRLVDEETFMPPVCLRLRCIGHTFRDAEGFQPKFSTSFGGSSPEQTLSLPPCALGDEIYYTFLIANSSDVAASFSFASDRAGIMSFQPAHGTLPAGSFELVTVRFRPLHARVYAIPVDLLINGSSSNGVRIMVVATGSSPRLALMEGSQLFVKPTGLGNMSSRIFTLRNNSRVPLHFRWRVPDAAADEIFLAPQAGNIISNDQQEITLMYIPTQVGKAAHQLVCDCLYVAGSEGSSAAELPDAPAELPIPQDVQPEIVHNLTIDVISEAVEGAISFTKPYVDVGAVQLGNSFAHPITLFNTSDGALRFRLGAVVQVFSSALSLESASLMGDLDKIVIHDPDYVRIRATSAPPARFVRTLSVMSNESTTRNSPSVRFDPPGGLLAPRSQLQVSVHFQPTLSCLHCIRVFVIMESESSSQSLPVNFSHLSKFSALQAAVDAEGINSDPALTDWDNFPFNNNPLWCDIYALGSIPTVQIEEARKLSSREAMLVMFSDYMSGHHNNFRPLSLGVVAQTTQQQVIQTSKGPPRDLWVRPNANISHHGSMLDSQTVDSGGWAFEWSHKEERPCLASPDSIWKQLSLSALNSYLSRVPTTQESGFSYLEDRAARVLSNFVFEFEPAVAGSAPAVYTVAIRNSGRMPAQLEFAFEAQMGVEPEPWVDIPEPSGRQAIVQDFLRRKIFDIQPRLLNLAPGESGLVRFHYAYATLERGGEHDIKVLLKVKEGRSCVLHLKGRTIAPHVPCLHLPCAAKHIQLSSVLVGNSQPPMQTISIPNISAFRTRYYLDEFTLSELAITQHGCRIFDVQNTSGIVEPGENIDLRVTFRPLETKEYELRIRLCYELAQDVEAYLDTTGAAQAVLSIDFAVTGWGFARDTSVRLSSLTMLPVEPLVMVGVPCAPAQSSHDCTRSVSSLLSQATWGDAASREMFADALYQIAGLDPVTAAVSTFHNPLDILTCMMENKQMLNLKHLLVSSDAAGGSKDPTVLFSGPDAAAASNSLSLFLRATDLLHELTSSEHNGAGNASTTSACQSVSHTPSGQLRKARASKIVPLQLIHAASNGLLSLLQRVAGLDGIWSRLCRPGHEPSRFHGASASLGSLTAIGHLDIPEAMCGLSSECVRFGMVPCSSISYRVIVLRNNRHRSSEYGIGVSSQINEGIVHFAWDINHEYMKNGALKIHPQTGTIRPGEAAIIRVTLHAPTVTQVFSGAVTCKITVDELEYQSRSEATLTTILSQREALRRGKHKIKPGSDTAHVSVAEKLTMSRSIHLQESMQMNALREARRSLIASLAKDPRLQAKPQAEIQQKYLSLTERFAQSKALVPKSPIRINEQAPLSSAGTLAGVLAGNMSVDDSALVLDLFDDETMIQANMAAVSLPPPPSCNLSLGVQANCCSMDDFIQLFSRKHLSAFWIPRQNNAAPFMPAEQVEEAMMSSKFLESFTKDLLSQLVADVAADTDIGLALGTSTRAAASTVAVPDVRTQLTLNAPPNTVFEELKFRGVTESVPLITRSSIGSAVASMGAAGDTLNAEVAVGHAIIDNRLPPLRATDFDLSAHAPVARVMRDSVDCQDFAIRLIESTLLALSREILTMDSLFEASSLRATSFNQTGKGGHNKFYEEDLECAATDDPDGNLSRVLERVEPEYKAGFEADDY